MTDAELKKETKRNGLYATVIEHTAWLSSDFGKNFALRVTGMTEEELECLVGRNKKGKRKGLLKGMITWQKVLHGGWYREDAYDRGGIVAPNSIVKVFIDNPYEPRKDYKPLKTMYFWEIATVKERNKIN
jgi:hypothetical protein